MPLSISDFYGKYLANPEAARRGDWDLAITGPLPDWIGNNGRASIGLMFDGRTFGPNTQNMGDYDNPEVNRLIDLATSARTRAEADSLWTRAVARITDDAPIIPLIAMKAVTFKSSRVGGCVVTDQTITGLNCGLADVWLRGAAKRGKQ